MTPGKNDSMRFCVLELFAGAGGLALGTEMAGFSHTALVEHNPDAAQTLRKNRPSWNVLEEDISVLSFLDLGDVFKLRSGELDLLSGGVPCQSFSHAGRRMGLEDTRGTLFHHFAIFLRKLLPKTFLFENVPGLLTHDGGLTFDIIFSTLSESNYTVQKKILNANNYGVAQKRERLLVLGVRNDLASSVKICFPEPQEYKPVLRDILKDVPESPGASYSEQKRRIFDLVPEGGNWRNIPEDIAREYMKSCWNAEGGRTGILRRLALDKPALTIMTAPAQKQTDRCHPLFSRPLTVRESARCQSFPDSWQFCGSMASQYRQIGNAVPVLLAKSVAGEIRKGLTNGTGGNREKR